MRSNWFASKVREIVLNAEAGLWIGTPFCKGARVRGSGVDCVQLAIALLRSTGFQMDPPIPKHYSLDSGQHTDRSLILDWLEESKRFDPSSDQQIGDVLCFNLGMSVHHVGIAMSSVLFIHAIRDYGVVQSRIEDPTYGAKLTHRFRPMEL